jgi:hypothetical protein
MFLLFLLHFIWISEAIQSDALKVAPIMQSFIKLQCSYCDHIFKPDACIRQNLLIPGGQTTEYACAYHCYNHLIHSQHFL